MAIRPDWDVGTITLTAGSRDFTTSGSALLTGGVEAGDMIITPTGHVLIIGATPTSQNAGVLFLPCPAAAAGANLPLRIRFQPDGSRYQAAFKLISTLTDSGNLEALAELTGADGKLPIFTGPGAMGLIDKGALGVADPNGSLAKLAAVALAANKAITTDVNGNVALANITAFARTLLDDADAAAARATLGVAAANALFWEIGSARGSDGNAFIDFHTTAVDVDYNARILRGSGTNGAFSIANVGTGAISIANPNGAVAVTGTALTYNGNKVITATGAMFTDAVAFRNGVYPAQGTMFDFSWAGGNRIWSASIASNNTPNFAWHRHDGSNGNYIGTVMTLNADGSVNITGNLTKASGTFLIDHPLDPANKNLRHGFVEAPEYVNVYRGDVRLAAGRATVDIDDFFGMSPGTFAALNTDVTVSSLQNQEGFARLRPNGPVDGGKFTIICEDENSTDLVAWMITGRRNDPYVRVLDLNCERETGRFIPEFEKEDA